MSGLSSVNAVWGGNEKVSSRSPNKTQSDVWCKIPLGEEFLFYTLVPIFTNFIIVGCFKVGAVDFMFLMKDLMLVMIILKTLSWWKVNLLDWKQLYMHQEYGM